MDFNENILDPSHIWSIRLLASKICLKMLQRSDFLVYDVFYIRILSRLIASLIDSSSSSSIIYAVLSLFEQLGVHVCRSFLLPYLFDINLHKISSSKSIILILECLANELIELINWILAKKQEKTMKYMYISKSNYTKENRINDKRE